MDKTFLIILIIFITSGVFIYDQYVTQKIGVSPVAKVLDYTGQVANPGNLPEDGLSNVSRFATFNDNAQQRLNRLSTIYHEIEEKRRMLLAQREEILNELTGLDDEIPQEAKKLQSALLTHEQDFLDLLQQLSAAHKIEQDGVKALEAKFNENNIYYESQFRDLVQQLIKVTSDDLKDLMYLYQQLDMEEQYLLESIQKSSDEFSSKNSYIEMQLNQILENLPQAQDLKEKIDRVRQKSDLYQKNTSLLRQLTDHEFFEQKKFLADLSQMMDIDLERMISDQTYAVSKNKDYFNIRKQIQSKKIQSQYQLKPKPIKANITDPIKPPDPSGQWQRPDPKEQQRRQKEISHQMERARDKATDQGW